MTPSVKRITFWCVIAALGLATLMFSRSTLMATIGVIVIVGTVGYLAQQVEDTREPLKELSRLQSAYDQLDQQAKLIIRTDMELHRTQEALDRRLASLMSLHQLGQQLQVNLRPEEVFRKLDAALLANFGFSQGLMGVAASFETLEWCALIGTSSSVADRLKTHLITHQLLRRMLANPAPVLVTASTDDPALKTLLDILGVPSVVLAGVMPHAGPAGCLILGSEAAEITNPKAEEELVAILANQLATAVENSALYEETWSGRQDMERKVQERTRELAQANDTLMKLNKAKSDFVSAVSHELRTPLAAIKGYAALLRGGQFGALAPAQADRITKMEKHADLLTQLITNLLDIARIESGRVTMEHRPIGIEELLTTVYDLVRPQLDAKHLRYQVDVDGVRDVMGDPQHLQRVFVNLLSNAIKYTPDGGLIRVGTRRDGDCVVSTVTDTGCGIASDELPKLFQEFYRSNDPINQQIRGTGLGLALVKRIVEAHHGHISVQSQKGKGTTFTVTLPAVSLPTAAP